MKPMVQLEFDGDCREAFERYELIFGGEITVMNAMGETPEPSLPPGSTPGEPGMIRFAQVRIGDGVLQGNDLPKGQYRRPQGFNIAVHFEQAADARRVFAGLAEGGEITTPLTKVAWAELFGQVRDRYGAPWLVLALGA